MTAPLNMSRFILGLQTWLKDVREGFVEITQHSLALLGLALVLVGLTFWAKPHLQTAASEMLFGWLQIRQSENAETPAAGNAATRSATQSLQDLPPDQLAVTRWLSRKYRISAEPMAAIVTEVWDLAARSQLPPTLILAIVAAESRFNPFASSAPGIVGLMQLELQAHAESFSQFGGPLSAFDVLTNLRVGVRHLQALVQQTESLEDALWLYGASSGQAMDNGYIERVLAEQKMLGKVTERANTALLAKPDKGLPL